MRKNVKMIWNVYIYNINGEKIEVFNIFDHYSFGEEVKKILKNEVTYEELADKLKSATMYYFWSKAEYEVVITTFPPYIDREEIDKLVEECDEHPYRTYVHLETGKKIDIYEQINMNWQHFVDYIWQFAKQVK